MKILIFFALASFGLAQTHPTVSLTDKKSVTKITVEQPTKPIESAEHVVFRTKYETAIKVCEGDQPLDPSRKRSADPVFDKKFDRLTRSLNAKIALQRVKNDNDEKGYRNQYGEDDRKRYQDANMRLAACEQSEMLEPQLEFVDSCIATYHQTIEKKNADLTVRETEQVKACQSLELYPPTK
jgi:hypothetical protein